MLNLTKHQHKTIKTEMFTLFLYPEVFGIIESELSCLFLPFCQPLSVNSSCQHFKDVGVNNANVENLAYLCRLNSCQVRFKQMVFEITKANSDCNELHSRLKKVEAKLDKIVQEGGSKLENHSKTIKSIPNSASAVEVKLNKVVQELGTRIDSHCKTIEAIPAKVPDLATTIASITSSLATEQREKEK